MHEHQMLAFAEIGIDRLPRERTPLRTLARFAAIEGVLQSPEGFLVVEHFGPMLQYHFAQDFGHRSKVF